ncbi:hypothetical protein OEW28_10805 [Defluviimonas sp. WL0002]|uniref:Acetyl-CoA hydrolase/transferase C-terminal domain-containing protein n=1 Tax=Albidovulum marisflavi TaxID=2984159 RepID=A0ABT2ZED8_9RHOB|nr:acetyl-CoA hydrolase/transferase C-terminal domain-containing protein [Defluviimonas sp. WL0002]MCV2869116.1 hypothetical protein [Defluviimonas sp. WL0002]
MVGSRVTMAGVTSRTDPQEIARDIVARVGPNVRLALPLGLGKAVTITNALTRLAEEDSSIRLDIFTALTLERPQPESDLHARFLGPAMDRLFGAYPDIRYAQLLRRDALPRNITVSEFFFMAGRWLGNVRAQAAHVTANYTHALGDLIARRPNVVAQLLAEERGRLSLSCNTDITVDLLQARSRGEASFLMVGEVNRQLPFMGGTGEIGRGEVDILLDDPDNAFELFSVVKRPLSLADHAIGLHVGRLVPDGGTLQIGIGQIGDAVSSALLLRHERPEVAASIWRDTPFPRAPDFKGAGFNESGPFRTGLYVVTEMLVEGILALLKAGVIGREAQGALVHAGFFLDSRAFYRTLREMSATDRARIAMVPVSFTNDLFGDEPAKRAARRDARFVNAAMKVTALGGVISDITRQGQTISGVGGQYNFVAQAHALDGARSVIALDATRVRRGRPVSNIVWDHPHETIPRHLRDIVVTQYGIADLRGRPDADAILAMIAISDSRFQEELLEMAKSAGKLPARAQVPKARRQNTSENLSAWLAGYRRSGELRDFPFGTDFSETEQRLLPALQRIKQATGSPRSLAMLALRGAMHASPSAGPECLRRLKLDRPATPRELALRWLVLGALAQRDR